MQNADNPLTDWIGRSETVEDTAYPTPAIALTATLDHPRTPLSADSMSRSATTNCYR